MTFNQRIPLSWPSVKGWGAKSESCWHFTSDVTLLSNLKQKSSSGLGGSSFTYLQLKCFSSSFCLFVIGNVQFSVWNRRADVFNHLLHPGGNWVSGLEGTRIYIPDRDPRPETRAEFIPFSRLHIGHWHIRCSHSLIWFENIHSPDMGPRTNSIFFNRFSFFWAMVSTKKFLPIL